MPIAFNNPGTYVDEVDSGARTITGVATSITAFVGYTAKGHTDKAVMITSYADFERQFGGLRRNSPVSYGVRQFFVNGGSQALIVRVATGFSTAQWQLRGSAGAVLDVEAARPGNWGNALRITVDCINARNPDSEFDLVVLQLQSDGTSLVTMETHRNLNMNKTSDQFAVTVVNNDSRLIRLSRVDGLVFANRGFALSTATIRFPLAASNALIAGTLDSNIPFQLNLAGSPWPNMDALVSAANNAIRTAGLDAALTASGTVPDGGTGGGYLKLTSAKAGEASRVTIAGGAFGGLAASIRMGFANGGREFNADAMHRPLEGVNALHTSPGVDGNRAGPIQLVGNASDKTGMQALLDADLFNLLSIPETFDMTDQDAGSVIAAATALCESRRAFYIVDAPKPKNLSNITTWANEASRSCNAATYFPAVCIADPLDEFQVRAMPPSGTLAGVYSRTDAKRGIWKAPAGRDATLNGVVDLAVAVNDSENDQLNPKGVNVLRSFPNIGYAVWGARTMKGSDTQADEYKYVPVRRLALFIEESIYRGIQWAVFEPNDEPLWARIRLNIGSFMHSLFRQGAFQGQMPKDAYFVKCDSETTTQNDITHGVVNIHVGFAPLKPAEFVIIRIQQMAGQVEV